MTSLYNQVCEECSKLVTQRYSTSFSMGIRLFDKAVRTPIYSIYGFVRFADEIVDTFQGVDKKDLLARLREDTHRAIEDEISLNPIIQAFQLVVNKYGIPSDYIDAFLDSMAMDTYKVSYDEEEYKRYIYGSAEVIGLMCLKVFVSDQERYESLVAPARSLGSAFQKINFLRDIRSDYYDRGRMYFPGLTLDTFDDEEKRKIEQDIEQDFDDAIAGVNVLPDSAKLGVKVAYSFYRKLLVDIKACNADTILERRIRIPNKTKIGILIKEMTKSRM